MTQNLQFANYIKSNQDYAALMTAQEWEVIRRQLTKEELASLSRGEPVDYKDIQIIKTTKG
jgi:hypothetical protein